MSEPDSPVGIVGAGPIGLATALRLASFGISSVILEADPTLRRQGSKACLIQGDVLEILDKFGCAEQVAGEGVTWHVGNTYVRGKAIRTTVYPRPIGYGPFVNISQYRIEQVMLATLEDEPLCEVRWSHRVTGLTQDADGVTVRVSTPQGDTEARFAYLVAADGVRSELRGIVGVRWTGYTHGDRFLITDIQAALPLRQERHFHYDPPSNPGRQLVMHPQPDSVWRIDWQLAPDTDIDEERRTGALDRRIRAVIGDVPYDIHWMSTYRFHQRVVESMRVGRVFFAGDAAHALPPYGARGMNSGLQDADNLAWKLAFVLKGLSGEDLLDTYHTERHAAARENLRITESTIRFMVPPNALRRWARSALLRLSSPVKALRDRINSGRMAEPYVYTDSPIVDPPGHPLVGSFAPDGAVFVAGRSTRLRRMFGAAFVGLYFGTDARAARRFVDEALATDCPVPVRLLLVLPAGVTPGELPPQVTVAHEEDPRLRATYSAASPRWYLVRPDGHIGAVGVAAEPGGVSDAPAVAGVAAVLRGTGEFADVVLRCAGALPPTHAEPAPSPAPTGKESA